MTQWLALRLPLEGLLRPIASSFPTLRTDPTHRSAGNQPSSFPSALEGEGCSLGPAPEGTRQLLGPTHSEVFGEGLLYPKLGLWIPAENAAVFRALCSLWCTGPVHSVSLPSLSLIPSSFAEDLSSYFISSIFILLLKWFIFLFLI